MYTILGAGSFAIIVGCCCCTPSASFSAAQAQSGRHRNNQIIEVYKRHCKVRFCDLPFEREKCSLHSVSHGRARRRRREGGLQDRVRDCRQAAAFYKYPWRRANANAKLRCKREQSLTDLFGGAGGGGGAHRHRFGRHTKIALFGNLILCGSIFLGLPA